MSERPAEMVSAAAERALQERVPRAPDAGGRRRSTIPCPFSASCPPIPARWLMCGEHWAMVPGQYKLVNRRISVKHGNALVTAAAGQALFWLWTHLELAVVNAPDDDAHRSDKPELCLCTWCGPTWRRVHSTLDRNPAYYLLLLRRAGRLSVTPEEETAWVVAHAQMDAAYRQRRREAYQQRVAAAAAAPAPAAVEAA